MGMITREEALALLEIDYDKEILSPILEKLDCKMEDLKK
jgi:hypothetical protein